MEQPEASSSSELQSTLSQRGEQGRASYTPASQHIEIKTAVRQNKMQGKSERKLQMILYIPLVLLCVEGSMGTLWFQSLVSTK